MIRQHRTNHRFTVHMQSLRAPKRSSCGVNTEESLVSRTVVMCVAFPQFFVKELNVLQVPEPSERIGFSL